MIVLESSMAANLHIYNVEGTDISPEEEKEVLEKLQSGEYLIDLFGERVTDTESKEVYIFKADISYSDYTFSKD